MSVNLWRILFYSISLNQTRWFLLEENTPSVFKLLLHLFPRLNDLFLPFTLILPALAVFIRKLFFFVHINEDKINLIWTPAGSPKKTEKRREDSVPQFMEIFITSKDDYCFLFCQELRSEWIIFIATNKRISLSHLVSPLFAESFILFSQLEEKNTFTIKKRVIQRFLTSEMGKGSMFNAKTV